MDIVWLGDHLARDHVAVLTIAFRPGKRGADSSASLAFQGAEPLAAGLGVSPRDTRLGGRVGKNCLRTYETERG